MSTPGAIWGIFGGYLFGGDGLCPAGASTGPASCGTTSPTSWPPAPTAPPSTCSHPPSAHPPRRHLGRRRLPPWQRGEGKKEPRCHGNPPRDPHPHWLREAPPASPRPPIPRGSPLPALGGSQLLIGWRGGDDAPLLHLLPRWIGWEGWVARCDWLGGGRAGAQCPGGPAGGGRGSLGRLHWGEAAPALPRACPPCPPQGRLAGQGRGWRPRGEGAEEPCEPRALRALSMEAGTSDPRPRAASTASPPPLPAQATAPRSPFVGHARGWEMRQRHGDILGAGPEAGRGEQGAGDGAPQPARCPGRCPLNSCVQPPSGCWLYEERAAGTDGKRCPPASHPGVFWGAARWRL